MLEGGSGWVLLKKEVGRHEWGMRRGENVFFKDLESTNNTPPMSLQSHLCRHTLHNRKLQPTCAGGSRDIFIACSGFSQWWRWMGWGVSPILFFLSQACCAAQHGPGSGAAPSNKNTFHTGNTSTAAVKYNFDSKRITLTFLAQAVWWPDALCKRTQKHITVLVFYLVILFRVWSTWSARTPEPPLLLSACCWWSPPEGSTKVKTAHLHDTVSH